MPTLSLPIPGVTPGPEWASALNQAISEVNDTASDAVPNTPEGRQALAESPELSATFARVITPEKFDLAAGTPGHDSTVAVQAMLSACATFGLIGQFSEGKTYEVSSKLTLHATTPVRLVGRTGHVIRATATMTAVLDKPAGGFANGSVLETIRIDGAQLAERCINIVQQAQLRIIRPVFENALVAVADFGPGNTQAYEIEWQGGVVDGRNSSLGGAVTTLPQYGIRTGGLNITDSRFTGIEIKNCRTPVLEAGQANWWDKVHVYNYPYKTASATLDWSVGSVGFDITGNHNRFISCYADTMEIGIRVSGLSNLIQNPLILWPGSHTPAYNPIGIDLIGQANAVVGGQWQPGNAAVVMIAGIRIGATAYNPMIVNNRFFGGAGAYQATPLVDLGPYVVGIRRNNYWNGGQILDRDVVNKWGQALETTVGDVDQDVVLKWATGLFDIVAPGGADSFLRLRSATSGFGFQVGGSTNKIGFFGNTPGVKPAATTSIQDALVNLGLVTGGDERPSRVGFRFRNADATLTVDAAEIQTVDASAGARTITLPTTTIRGVVFLIKKVDASANTVTIAGTIDGSANYVLSTQWKFVRVVSNGTANQWNVIATG